MKSLIVIYSLLNSHLKLRIYRIYGKASRIIWASLFDLFVTTAPLDEKMVVLLGLATYSYKRLKEIYELRAFNSIAGRSCVRVMIEDYIMMKYLVKNEQSHDNIWREYQLYGIGLYKLVLSKISGIQKASGNHISMKIYRTIG